MKELRVKIKYEEDDSYVELWQIVGQKKYIGRFTYGPQKEWVYVSDPLGYREMDYALSPDIKVIVCDQDGNDLFETHNCDESVNFNTAKQEAYHQFSEWSKQAGENIVCENKSAQFFAHWATGHPVGKFNDWLCSFQDPDLYPEANDYPENWLWCKTETTEDPETLQTYEYLGEKMLIERYHCRHKICGVEWDEYYSGGEFIGHVFDGDKIGPMYSESQAKKLVTKAILSHFAEHTRAVSFVQMCGRGDDRYPVQRNVQIGFACDHLLNGNYHRDFVDEVVKKETEASSFYKDGFRGIGEIREIYPECIEDHTMYL